MDNSSNAESTQSRSLDAAKGNVFRSTETTTIKKQSFLKKNFRNKQLWLYAILSVIFTIWYCRFIFAPSDQMIGVNTTDAYQVFACVNKAQETIGAGHLPMGTSWLFDFYGGSVATPFFMNIIPDVGIDALLVMTSALNDIVLSYKIIAFMALLISQFFSYKLAKFYLRNTSAAWIVALVYSFTGFYLTEINWGHPGFLMAAALMPAVLYAFEIMFNTPTRRNMAVSSVSLIVMFFCDFQITAFAIYYLLFRMAYHLVVNRNRNYTITAAKRSIEATIIFIISIAPFLINFAFIQNVGALSVPTIPMQYVTNPAQVFSKIAYSDLYIGISILILALVPIFLLKHQPKQNRPNYIFHLIALVIFLLIVVGTPLATLATTILIRVPSRAQMVMVFSVAMCAGYGLLTLKNYLNQKSYHKYKLLNNKRIRTLMIIGFATIMFTDLTIGMLPTTSTIPTLSGSERFIEKQEDTFRVLKYPMVWGYTNYEASLIKHEIVGSSVITLRDYPQNSQIYSALTVAFEDIESSSNNDAGNLALLATLCGVKYILIDFDAAYSIKYVNFFDNATEYFVVSYKDLDSVVYENINFRGFAFAIKDEGQAPPTVANMSISEFLEISLTNTQVKYTEKYNEIEVLVNSTAPAYIVLSQSYNPYWALKGAESTSFIKALNLSAFQVNEGTYKVNAEFTARNQTWNVYISVFTTLILISVALYADSKGQRNLVKIALATLFGLGIVLTAFAFTGTSMAPSLLRTQGFGPIFNGVILSWGAVVAFCAIIVLARRKIITLARKVNIHKKFLYDEELKSRGLKEVLASGLIVASVLTVAALLLTSSTPILHNQIGFDGLNAVEEQVNVGSALTLTLSARVLLLAALTLFLVSTVFRVGRFLADINEQRLTTTLIEVVSLSACSVLLLYSIYKGSVSMYFGVNFVGSIFFWLILSLSVSLFLTVFHLIRGPIYITSISGIQSRIVYHQKLIRNFTGLLLIAIIVFSIISNIAPFTVEAEKWLYSDLVGVLIISTFLYLASVWIQSAQQTADNSKLTKEWINTATFFKQKTSLRHSHLGVLGGFIGICVAGLIIKAITMGSEDYFSSSLIICGLLGGIGFGVTTSGNSRLRGLIACVFGFTAMLFGLIMAYTTPIILGYTKHNLTGVITSVLKWHEYSFIEFTAMQLLSLSGLFYLLLGLILAYLAGSRLSLRTKRKEIL